MKMGNALVNLILGGCEYPAIGRDADTPPGWADLKFNSIEIRQNEVVFLHNGVAMLTLDRGEYAVRGVVPMKLNPP